MDLSITQQSYDTSSATTGIYISNDEKDYELRPSGVIIKRKYTSGLILGYYREEQKQSTACLVHRSRGTTGESPMRRRDAFCSSLSDISRQYPDQTDLVEGSTMMGGLTSEQTAEDTSSGSVDAYTSVVLDGSKAEGGDRLSSEACLANNSAVRLTKCQMKIHKCWSCCKAFLAFIFSTIGLFCLLIGYVILGGLIFSNLESPNEKRINAQMGDLRGNMVKDLWDVTKQLNVLHHTNWTRFDN